MTISIASDLGAWLVLRRVQWDSVTLDVKTETLYDHGRRLPACLTPHVHQLANHGYVQIGEPLPEMLPCRPVRITDAGEHLLNLLYDLSRTWQARLRAGLPRHSTDLDTLARVLNDQPGHRSHDARDSS